MRTSLVIFWMLKPTSFHSCWWHLEADEKGKTAAPQAIRREDRVENGVEWECTDCAGFQRIKQNLYTIYPRHSKTDWDNHQSSDAFETCMNKNGDSTNKSECHQPICLELRQNSKPFIALQIPATKWSTCSRSSPRCYVYGLLHFGMFRVTEVWS